MECRDSGKGVKFHAHGTIRSPHTDGTTIHLFEPNALWSEEQWWDWEYEVYHEIGHESPENCKPHWLTVMKKNKIDGETILGSLCNLVSDHVQEHNRVGQYSGRDRILKRGRSRFVTDRLLSDACMHKEFETKEGRIFKSVAIFDTLCREEWNEYLVGSMEHAVESLDGEEEVKVGRLLKSGLRIQDGKNEDEAYEIAKKILEILGEDVEKHVEEMEKAFDEKEKKGEDDGEGEEGEEGEGESMEGGEDGEDEEGDATGKMSEKSKKEIKGLQKHSHYSKPETGKSSYASGSHIEYSKSEYGSNREFPVRDCLVVDLKKDIYPPRVPKVSAGDRDSYIERINNINCSNILERQLRNLIISRKQSRWEQGKKRGKISGKNIWKAATPVYSSSVFKKRVSKMDKDTAILILTDNSGSMSGNKFAHAAKAGILLANALMKSRVPVELASFSEVSQGPLSIIVKPFSETTIKEDELTSRYAACAGHLEQNSDGESILWAANRLMKRDESRKVLIVLSDGSPCAYAGGYGEEVAYTKQVISTIEDHSPIEIYGVGIMDDNVKKFYKEYTVIKHATELEDSLLGIVKQKLFK